MEKFLWNHCALRIPSTTTLYLSEIISIRCNHFKIIFTMSSIPHLPGKILGKFPTRWSKKLYYCRKEKISRIEVWKMSPLSLKTIRMTKNREIWSILTKMSLIKNFKFRKERKRKERSTKKKIQNLISLIKPFPFSIPKDLCNFCQNFFIMMRKR